MKFKHYLFDLDGTITSTKEIHQKSFNQALEFFNKKIVEDKDLVLYEAMPSFDKLKLYNELNKEDINPDDFLLIKNYYSNQNIEKSEELYDEGVFNIFKYLKNIRKLFEMRTVSFLIFDKYLKYFTFVFKYFKNI